MKHTPFLCLFLLFGGFAHAEADWRTFKSPDGERTFEGKLVAFNDSTDTVTVLNRQGQKLYFKQDLISEEDRAYVKATAPTLAPDISLDVRFEKLQDRGESVRGGRARTTNYDAGYKISLNNYTAQDFENVEVEYLLIYRKDNVKDSGEDKLVQGKASAALISNGTSEVETQTVTLTSFYQKGVVSKGGCGGGSCKPSSASRSQRSRDYLVGCVALVKVNGHVVDISATAPNLLERYKSELEGSESYTSR